MFNSVYGIYPLDANPHFNLNNQRHLRTLPNVPWGSKSRTKLIPSREPLGYLAQGNNGSDPIRSGKVQVQQAMRRSVTRTSKRVGPFAVQAINTVAERGWEDGDGKRLFRVRMRTKPSGRVCVCVGGAPDRWLPGPDRHRPFLPILCCPKELLARSYRKNLLHQARTMIPVLTGANLEQEQTLSTESSPFKFVMRIEGGDRF